MGGAVRLVAEQKRPIKQVAANLGACVDTFSNWVKSQNGAQMGGAGQNWALQAKIPTDEGWLYCAIVKDLCTRQIVGHACSAKINAQLALDVLNMAIRREYPPKGRIYHIRRIRNTTGYAGEFLLYKGRAVSPGAAVIA